MTIDEFITVTKALSDQQRVRALLALKDGELCVCQIIELLGLAPSTVSKHMSILKQAGIVGSRKEGKWVYYFLNEAKIKTGEIDFIKLAIDNLNKDKTIETDRSKLQNIKKMNLTALCRLGECMAEKLKILFLCTGNSCRSQMAEGWAKYLKGDVIEPYSAGIETHGLNPNAVKVMAEAGVDISNHKSKLLDELKGVQFDWVITVCDNANESCPVFPGKVNRFHISFDDPPRLAKSANSEEETLNHYRRVRDDIKRFVSRLPEVLEE